MKETEEEKYRCECGKTFQSYLSLRTHQGEKGHEEIYLRRQGDLSKKERVKLYHKAKELRRKHGWGFKRIARHLRISKKMVQGWITQGRKPRSLRLKERTPSASGWNKKSTKPQESISEEKAWILAVIGPGDGCVDKGKVELSVTNREFAKRFGKLISSTYGIGWNIRTVDGKTVGENSNFPYPPKCFSDKFVVYAHSVEMCENLLQYEELEHFKEGNEKVPEKIFQAEEEIKSSYLQGFMDSQGCIYANDDGYDSRVVGRKSNTKVLKELQELLSDLDIKSRVRSDSGEKKTWTLDIRGNEDILKYREKVSFSIPYKKEKLDKVVEKIKSPYECDICGKKFEDVSTLGGHYHTHDSKWSPKKIVNDLREADENCEGILYNTDVSTGLVQAAQRYFGSWNEAKKEAGLEVIEHPTGKHEPWSEEEKKLLREKYPTHGTEIPELLEKRGRQNIRSKANRMGLKTEHGKEAKRWSKDKVIEELREAEKKHGSPLKERDIGTNSSLYGAVNRYFDNWNHAKREAGLETIDYTGDISD